MALSKLTRISLPQEEYLLLLGISISVFSSNYSFLIENILKNDTEQSFNWHDLVDENKMKKIYKAINDTITPIKGASIIDTFKEIIVMRNRIIHSFRITSKSGEQVLATKDPDNQKQFEVSKEYLKDFIQLNNKFSDLLHELRGY
ncbi:MAG: hypothetical protein AB7E09_06895 [Candidatus Izemoplasmatales bacterium]